MNHPNPECLSLFMKRLLASYPTSASLTENAPPAMQAWGSAPATIAPTETTHAEFGKAARSEVPGRALCNVANAYIVRQATHAHVDMGGWNIRGIHLSLPALPAPSDVTGDAS